MYNFKVKFHKILYENLLRYLQTPIRIDRLKVWLKPWKVMYDEFRALRRDVSYRVRINGTVIYLETALNNKFDNVLRRIYIAEAAYDKVYIYLKSESKPAIVLYRKWDSAIAFPLGSFCWYQGDVYEATTASTNKIPGVDPEWTLRPARKAPILRKKLNYTGETSFYVMVPTGLVYSDSEMKALVNTYKLAGRGYLIKTF